MTEGYHNLSHHGQEPGKMAQLTLIEIEQIKNFREFLAKLQATDDGGGTLLDRTTVLLGSNLGQFQQPQQRKLANHPSRRRLPSRPTLGVQRK